MDEIEIKTEFDVDFMLRCRACLSVGRKLLPIGKYLNIYKKLALEFIHTNSTPSEEVKLCWECHTHLRKASLFQQQVMRASEIIQNGQCSIYGTLSCLTTVVINDTQTHTVYINDATIQTELKVCNKIEHQENEKDLDNVKGKDLVNDNNDNSSREVNNSDDDYFNEDVVENDDLKRGIDKETSVSKLIPISADNEKIEAKKRGVSKWATKRALQNRKPKFRIVSQEEFGVGKIYRKLWINVEQLRECIERERDSDKFRSSKYKCDSCVRVFENESMLVKHNDVYHENAGTCVCDICQTRLKRRRLMKHMKNHFNRYECRLCEKLYCESELRTHLLEKHAKVFQCIKCELLFSCRQEFSKHFKDWHEKFVCDHCGVSFKMKYCIKDHLRKQHSPFECVTCGKRFARYNGLWLHNKLRHAPALPPAYCVECDTRYRDVYRYRWHLANSTRHKPKKKVKIPCPDCEKVFTKRIYMTNHREFVHLKQFKYRCEQCDKNFIRNADLVKHRRKIHEGIAPPKNKICNVCGKGFHTNKILSNHVRTHTGERPFACMSCPARFAQHAALRGHMRALHPPAVD